MSDHLIAEANRHASALPEDLSTIKSSVLAEDVIKALSDIAWYVRECETLRSECEALRTELHEEALLNGKGSEREAALLAKVERLERENAAFELSKTKIK